MARFSDRLEGTAPVDPDELNRAPEQPRKPAALPAPEDAPEPKRLPHEVARFAFRDADGRRILYKIRVQEPEKRKEFRLIHWSGKGWEMGGVADPHPLYGLDRLTADPDAPVVLTEGEAKADRVPEGFVGVSVPNGSGSAKSVDWTPLAGRRVIVWPDADEAGLAMVEPVRSHLKAVGARVTVVDTTDFPPKWDLADPRPLPEGLKEERLEEAATGFVDLSKLVEQAKADAGAPFRKEVISELAVLRQDAPGEYERIRRQLMKDAKVRVSHLDSLVDRHLQEEDEAAAAPAAEAQTKRARADAVIDFVKENAKPFPSNGIGYADVIIAGRRETLKIRSKAFRDWLSGAFYKAQGKAANTEEIQNARNVIELEAKEAPEREVFVRVARHDGRIYVDLGDDKRQIVEITAKGWKIITDAPVRFFRPSTMQPMPVPQKKGSVDDLRPFLNVIEDDDFKLVIAWLLGCFGGTGEYVHLVLSGEHGTAKSTFTSLVQSIADPSSAGLRSPPKNDQDVFIAAANAHLLAFDNMSSIQGWLSDVFCRIATGATYAGRTLYENDDETVLRALNPIVINGIGDLISRQDLVDRSIFIRLEPIQERKVKSRIRRDFEAKQPGILGALFDMISTGLRREAEVEIEDPPRMAGFANWIAACEPEGTMLTAYREMIGRAIREALDSDLVSTLILEMMDDPANHNGWQGTMTDLLEALNRQAKGREAHVNNWPRSPKAAGNQIVRVQPGLREIGINIKRWFGTDKKKTRWCRIEKVSDVPSDGRRTFHC